MRLRCVAQRKRRVDDRLRTAPDSISGHTCSLHRGGNARPFPRPDRGRSVDPVMVSRRCRIGMMSDRRLHAASCRDLHQPAVHRQHVDVALQVVAADHVEHDVDAAAACDLLRSTATKSASR